MSSLNSSPKTLTVLVPQSTIDKVVNARVEKRLRESRLNDEVPEFEDEEGPRRLGPIILVATIVTSLLVFSGLQVADSHAPASLTSVSVSTGIQTMSAAELIQSVKTQNLTAYWLAPVPGDSYSITTSASGVNQISYYPEGSGVSNSNQSAVSVATYKDLTTYEASSHPFLGANSRTDVLNNGSTVTYSSVSPTQAFVSFPDTAQKVVISYPSNQPVPTILNDAENLVLVQ